VELRLLGPTYPYWKNIKQPKDIGMSDDGSLSALARDVGGLIDYTELLVTGQGDASSTGKPLGNKFFLKTGGKCKDPTGNEVDRYIYIDNVPTGNIPFISSGLDTDFSDFRGLIPGTMSDMNVLNPFAIMQAFLAGSLPDCRKLTMETIDINNNSSTDSQFITDVDIKNMDPCIFGNGYNPVSNKGCNETYTNMNQDVKISRDPLVKLYFAGLAGIGIYMLYKIMKKT
jgi:hypothetical protein